MPIVDAWIQHPTPRMLRDPMFASIRRWTGASIPDELVIVAGHVGYPWTTEMIALATKYPGVHIDTSAWKPSRFPAELTAYLRGHGREKVLFGSNWPMLAPGACLAEVDALSLDEEARRLYLHENAARVFRLDA